MVAAGRRSTDLRVRIVYSLGEPEPVDGRYRMHEAVPVETLVEQARGSTDPIALSLLVDRCELVLQKAGRCDAVDLARRWTVADTQNALAWIVLSNTLAGSGDVDGAREAFQRAAQAPQWREYYTELTRLLTSAAANAADVRLRIAEAHAAFAKASLGLPNRGYQTISTRCRDVTLADACGKVIGIMARDAGSLLTLTMAAALARERSALPFVTIAAIRQRADAMHWASTSNDGSDVRSMTPAEMARAAVELDSLIAHGELETLRRTLQASGVAESEAARRYVATLGVEQIARRASLPQRPAP